MDDWTPSSFEDRLLEKYFETHPGTAYLEVALSPSGNLGGARRIDALLVPGRSTCVYRRGDCSIEKAAEGIRDQCVHVIEAKNKLNRNVIGQVMVGEYLVESAMNPASVAMDIVCASGDPDLEGYCEHKGIGVYVYPKVGVQLWREDDNDCEGRVDRRRAPDEARRGAFLAGWTKAVNGELFGTIHSRKTHANMGNLFGWIYGDQPVEFRLETWRRYVENSTAEDVGGGQGVG